MRAWRDLTGGLARGRDADRRTLLACSAGADSSAMAAALASGVARRGERFVVAHIVHDLRPAADADADRAAAEALAQRLGLPFVVGRAPAAAHAARHGGNIEAAARRLRYAALARLARANACPFLAVAHHADDQLETLLMNLIRGSGPTGLMGMPAARPLGRGGVTLIRPMLGLTREDARRLCAAAAIAWREDATNADTSRFRAAIRANVVPALLAIRPRAAQRAASAAALLRQLRPMIAHRAGALLLAASTPPPGGRGPGEGFPSCATAERDQLPKPTAASLSFPIALLQPEPAPVLAEFFRLAINRLDPRGRPARDRCGSRQLAPLLAAINRPAGHARTFRLGGLSVRVTERHVVITRPVPRP